MDARKIQFLIGIQREIDKLETKEGNTPKIEKVKSRFYDVVEIEGMVGKEENHEDEVGSQSQKDSTASLRYESEITNNLNEQTVELKNSNTFFPSPSPKSVADFMRLFNNAEGLKYLTHDFDEADKSFDINAFIKQAKQVFDEAVGRPGVSKGRFQIPRSLWSIVNQFAFEENPAWGWNLNNHEGWSTTKWIKWSKKNARHPYRNPSFEKTIESFRRLTRIEAPQLQKIIKTVIATVMQDQENQFTIKLVDCNKADFYTNVDYFKKALELIFGGIKKRDSFPTVSIQYIRKSQGDYKHRIVRICQHNSLPDKPLEDVLDELKNQKGDFWGIKKNLQGYCDWQIETMWNGIPVRVNLLNTSKSTVNQPDSGVSAETDIELLKDLEDYGFCHILTFYYR